ncbi:MAG: ATP-binding protein [Salinimicrobium sp.]
MKKGNYILNEQFLSLPHSLFNGDSGPENQDFLLFITSLDYYSLKATNFKSRRYFKNKINPTDSQDFFGQIVHPEDYPLLMSAFQKCDHLSISEENEISVRLRSPFGYWKKYLFKNRLYTGFEDEDEKYILSIARAVDPYRANHRKTVSTNFETEKSLQESLNRYRVLVNSLDEGFMVVEMLYDLEQQPIDFLFVEINPALERHTHLSNPLGRTMKEFFPNHEQYWFDKYGKVALSGEPVRFEKYSQATETWFDMYVFPFGSQKSKKVAVLCSDITERKLSEEKLRKANEMLEYKVQQRTQQLEENHDLLQMVFDTVTQGIFLLKPYFGENFDIIDFTYVRVNKKVVRYYKQKEMVGKRFLKLNPQAASTGAFEIFKQTMLTGESKDFEVCFERNGKNNWFKITTRRQKGLLVNSLENITRRKLRAQNLKENIRFKKQLINTSPDIILIFNLYEEKVRFMNRDFTNDTALTKQKIEGMPLLDLLPLIHPQDREKALKFHDRIMKAGDKDICELEFRLRGKEKTWNCYNARAKIFMRNKNGNVYEYIVLLRNVQEQKQTQQALIHAEKLSIKGEIARTLAHELRSPLASIGMSADILNQKTQDPDHDSLQNYIDIIKRSTSNLNKLVTDLLSVSNYSPAVLVKCCLAETTNKALELAQDRIYLAGVKVKKNYKGPYFINADEDKLKIALLNIIVNASEAMLPDEGELTLSITKSQKSYILKISDNGCGMEKEQLERLFESFYTQKPGGMGVGLSSVKNILEEHGATVKVRSKPNLGTTFILSFPCYEEEEGK